MMHSKAEKLIFVLGTIVLLTCLFAAMTLSASAFYSSDNIIDLSDFDSSVWAGPDSGDGWTYNGSTGISHSFTATGDVEIIGQAMLEDGDYISLGIIKTGNVTWNAALYGSSSDRPLLGIPTLVRDPPDYPGNFQMTGGKIINRATGPAFRNYLGRPITFYGGAIFSYTDRLSYVDGDNCGVADDGLVIAWDYNAWIATGGNPGDYLNWQCPNIDADIRSYTDNGIFHIEYSYDGWSTYDGFEINLGYFTVTFNANGGTVGTASMTTKDDGTLKSLPQPARESYTFDGWFTSANDGTQITSSTVFTQDATVYAHWSLETGTGGTPVVGGSGGGMPVAPAGVTVSNTQNGSVTLSNPSPSSGESVTITAIADDGYVLGSLKITDSSGNELAYTDNMNGTYTFAFTSDAVTVTITFINKIEADRIPLSAFTDVSEDDWFYSDVLYAYENGLFAGTSATSFEPGMLMTRGMLMTVLWRMAGEPEPVSESEFEDLTEDWYKEAIAWAQENGIVTGYGDMTFGPDDSVARQDVAVILMRYMTYAKISIPVTEEYRVFADEDQIEGYAKDAVQTMNKLGVINGMGENTINPRGNATRAEVSAILHRFMEKTKDVS